MIQFNLLPDVKLAYIKAQRQKHLVMVISSIVTAIALFIFIFLLVLVDGLQTSNISSLSKNINNEQKKIEDVSNLNKILTVQNQLQSLPALHNQKPVASRLFGFLAQVTPSQANITTSTVDFAKGSINLEGGADTLVTVNKFVDTLKFTTYSAQPNIAGSTKAFSNVVLSSFAVTNGTSTSYTINFNFDPLIFSENNNATLTVPQLVTTRSEIDHPSDLFQKAQPVTPGVQ